MDISFFVASSEKEKLLLSSKQLEQFHLYYQWLIQENDKYNLTAITKMEEVYEKHFYDSLSPLFVSSLTGKRVLDVGAGAGFPSIPLKIMDPSISLYVMDATAKKVAFVQQVAKQMPLQEVTTLVARAEEYHEQTFDVVVARGVASLSILLELVCRLVKPNGIFIAYKGSRFQEELDASQHAMQVLGFQLIQSQLYTLPSEQASRCNLFFKKIAPNDKLYPRPFSKIKHKPL